ncbi:histidine kinase [Streptosporangium sp. NPDC051023]|uniref:sensor histidine kinase n=1 Tax=Streptosporangium sp. NPDC051023 TaxID=3155410 RepID=UPI003450D3C3
MRTPQPGETGGSRRTRPARADYWLAGALAAGSAAASLLAAAGPPYRDVDLLGLVLVTAAPLFLLWRQVTPLLVLTAASTALVVNEAAGYAVTVVQWPAWIALFTCFSLHGGWLRRLAAALVTASAVGGYLVLDRGSVSLLELSGITMCFLIATVAGDATLSRRAYTVAAEARFLSEARERAMLAERVLIEERARLARELHDALGHAVNVMVMQAGVGRRVFAENPDFGHEALGHIETLGRGALDELDRLLRVLHPAADGAGHVTAEPTTADLGELAGRVRAAGRDLELNTGEVDLAPSGARALYRIIQEAVTNALRHTDSGRIRVDLAQVDDRVLLEVTNEGTGIPAPVAGRGLVNMRERARLEGGDLEAGPVTGGFSVRAFLPGGTGAGRS